MEAEAGASGWVRAVIWLVLPLAGLSFMLAALSGARLASRAAWDERRAVAPVAAALRLPQAAQARPDLPDALEHAWREAVRRTGLDLGLPLDDSTGVQAGAGVAEARSGATAMPAPIEPDPASGMLVEARPLQPDDRTGAQAGPAPATSEAETVQAPPTPPASEEAEAAPALFHDATGAWPAAPASTSEVAEGAPALFHDAAVARSVAPAQSGHAAGAQAALTPAPHANGAVPAPVAAAPMPSRLEAPARATPDAHDRPAAARGTADVDRASRDAPPVPGARTEASLAPPAPATPRVFIHHRVPAGATAADALAARLRRAGITVAAVRSVAATPAAREIRYFHFGDDGEAADLVRLLGAPAWRVRDFRSYPAPPRPGTLEIWLPDRAAPGISGGRPG